MKNKKIISSLLIISMMMCLLPMKIFMATGDSAQSVTLKIIPTTVGDNDITPNNQLPPETTPTAHKGDTITYTIKMGPVQNLAAMQLQLSVPDGLIFGSGELVPNIKNTLNLNNGPNQIEGDVDFATFNDDCDYKRIVIYGGNYTSDGYTDIATFSCTVDNNAEINKDYEVSFSECILVSTSVDQETSNPLEIPSDVSNLSSTVRVAAASQRKKGDVNNDGRVNTRDVKLLYDYVSSDGTDQVSAKYFLENEDFRAANINGDKNADETDKINTRDVKLLYDYVSSDGTDPISAKYFEE